MAPPPELEEAVSTAQQRLLEFQEIVERIGADWVPRSEVDQLRAEVAKLRAERDAWRRKYETLNSSLIPAVDITSNGPVPRAPLLEIPYHLKVGDNNRCKIQPVAGGQIVTDCITLNHNALHWNRRPTSVFIMKKPYVQTVTLALHEMATWLHKEQQLRVFIQHETIEELASLGLEVDAFNEWSPVVQLDFAISLGGDGTILFLVQLFENAVPPIVAFAMGSLGFLTPLASSDYKPILTQFIEKGKPLTIRNRLDCRVLKKGEVVRQEVVMNEVVVDRGTSAHLTNLDCYVDDTYCTTVQGDGCIISTPTGSTAYSLSAGGSICHPQVPCMILTPISPHSLSFRPVVFQHSIHFRITLSKEARDTAWVSFDGRNRVLLEQGDELLVQHSRFPVALVCNAGETEDWLCSVTGCLRWNSRDQQKAWRPSPRNGTTFSGRPTKLSDDTLKRDLDDPLHSLRRRALKYVPDSHHAAKHFTIEAEGPPGTPPCTPPGTPPCSLFHASSPWKDKSLLSRPCPLLQGRLTYSPSEDSLDNTSAHMAGLDLSFSSTRGDASSVKGDGNVSRNHSPGASV
eukprot:GGOE01065463.1.p1 GENE.GGOE01065463.1~~GGOE01065463.1.p1  ORF type:complete len:579 (-),score=166.96 GGOE01065463.1:78-1790(-)